MTTNPSPLAASALRRGIDALAVVSLLAAVALIHGPVFGGTTGYVAALGGLVVGVLVAALTAALLRGFFMFRQRKMFAPWLRKPGCSGLPAFPEGACRACLKTGRGGLRKVSFVRERSGDESWNGQAKALLRLA